MQCTFRYAFPQRCPECRARHAQSGNGAHTLKVFPLGVQVSLFANQTAASWGSPRNSCVRRLNLPSSALRNIFFRTRLLLLVTTAFNALAGAKQFHLCIYVTGVVVHNVLEMLRIRARVFGVASLLNSALRHSNSSASSTMNFVRIPTSYFEKVSFRDSPRGKDNYPVGLTRTHVCANDV